MTREVALLILSFIVNCGGFTIRSKALVQRWRQNYGGRPAAYSPRNSSNSRKLTCFPALDICGRGGGSRHRSSSSGVVQMSISEMIGADVESGGVFDPLGFSEDEPSLFRRRAVELKHGRVAMLAVTGIVVQTFVRFPGFPPFPVSNAARPLAVLKGLMSDKTNSVLLALLVIGALELTIGKQDYVDRAPGELGEFGTFAKPVDEDEWFKVQMAELKHGRLAMLGVVGCFVQEAVTGQGPVEQLLLGNISPFS